MFETGNSSKSKIPWREAILWYGLDKLLHSIEEVGYILLSQVTTTIHVESNHPGYSLLLAHLSKLNENNRLLREFNLVGINHPYFWPQKEGQRWTLGLGFHRHWFFFKSRLAWVDRCATGGQDSESGEYTEYLVVTFLSRNKELIHELLAEGCPYKISVEKPKTTEVVASDSAPAVGEENKSKTSFFRKRQRASKK